MTDILSNNIVRGVLAVLVLGAVAYGIDTTLGDDTTATDAAANTENVSATVGDEITTTEGTTTEGTTVEETDETTTE